MSFFSRMRWLAVAFLFVFATAPSLCAQHHHHSSGNDQGNCAICRCLTQLAVVDVSMVPLCGATEIHDIVACNWHDPVLRVFYRPFGPRSPPF